MPFKSKAQRRWMYATHPSMAKRWEKETPKGSLPEKVKTASIFDELEKIASVSALARLGAGLFLGSMLWGALSKDKKEEITQASRNLGSSPAILPMTEAQRSVVEKELRKADPDLRGVMADMFKRPEDLDRDRRIRAIRQRWGDMPIAVRG